MRVSVVLATACLVFGCGNEENGAAGTPTPSSTTTANQGGSQPTGGTSNVGGSGGILPAGGTGGTGGQEPDPDWYDSGEPLTIAGQLIWEVDFDAAAEANGSSDCTLVVNYDGQEDRTVHYLCPLCERMYQVNYDVPATSQQCATAIGLDDTGYIGHGNGKLYAHSTRLYRLHSVADATVQLSQQQLSVSGTGETYKFGLKPEDLRRFTSTVTGQLALSVSSHDPNFGLVPPDTDYLCGYDKSGLPAYDGSWVLSDNDIPDGVFIDSCGEAVRLHDLLGQYVLLEASAVLCGPCNKMAEEEPAFELEMKNLGLSFTSVTFLISTIAGFFDTPPVTELEAWDYQYQLHGPIVADRGYGHNVIGPYVQQQAKGTDPEDYNHTSYPSWVLINPNGKILGSGLGAAWYNIRKLIKQDAGIL